MMLCLYNYYPNKKIENIFSWAPKEDQWWVTGFNPKFTNPDPDIMTSIGKIDFGSEHRDLYIALKETYTSEIGMISKILPPNMKKEQYFDARNSLFFDEDGHTLWVLWG